MADAPFLERKFQELRLLLLIPISSPHWLLPTSCVLCRILSLTKVRTSIPTYLGKYMHIGYACFGGHSVTDQLVDETCSAFPQSQIEYMRVAGVGDTESLYATMRQWLAWLEQRFDDAIAGNSTAGNGCSKQCVTGFRPSTDYLLDQNWHLQLTLKDYLLE
jgi:hypothetical protein